MITLTALQRAKDDVLLYRNFDIEDIFSLRDVVVTEALDAHCSGVNIAGCAKTCCRTCILKKLNEIVAECEKEGK